MERSVHKWRYIEPWRMVVLSSPVLGLLALSLLMRLVCFPVLTVDMTFSFSQWFELFMTDGGFAAIGHETTYARTNYPPAFLYLFAVATYFPFSWSVSVKAVFVAFDYLAALVVWRLLKANSVSSPAIHAALFLFLPTALINASFWGQCDMMWVSLTMGSVALATRGRWHCCLLLLGLAFSFKPWAAFAAPAILLAMLRAGQTPLLFVYVPIVYILTTVPAILSGAPVSTVLSIYANQPGQMGLNFEYPNVYGMLRPYLNLGSESRKAIRGFGYLLTAMGSLFIVIRLRSKEGSGDRLLKESLLFAIVIPFLAPGMHERYSILADVLSFVCACCDQRYRWICLTLIFCSLTSYLPFLIGVPSIYVQFLPGIVLGCLAWILVDLTTSASLENPFSRTSRAALLRQSDKIQ